MKQPANNLIQPLINLPNRLLTGPGRWLSRFTFVTITTLCVSTSTAVWADSKSFDFSGFDGISAAEEIHVQVTMGKVFQITAESDDPMQLKCLELDVRRGVLQARMDKGLTYPNLEERKRVTINVTMPSLLFAEASKGANITVDDMSGTASELAATSGSSIQINVIGGGSMSVNVLRGAEIKIARGICTSLSADVSGGSFLGMGKVICAEVEIDASSGSQASVHADESIKAGASGGSKVRVYGTPERNEIDVSSGGEIVFP